MTKQGLNQYKNRLKIARQNFEKSNPSDTKKVNETFKQYKIALQNYKNALSM